MHTWSLLLSFIPFGYNATCIFKCLYLEVEMPQVGNEWQNAVCLLTLSSNNNYVFSLSQSHNTNLSI